MLAIGGCMLGAISYERLPVELLPEAELPMLIVQVQSQREADPQHIESQAVIPVESAIAGLEGIESIETVVERRSASLAVFYSQDSDQRYAFLKLQQEIEAVAATLGEDYRTVVRRIDTEQIASRFMTIEARGVGAMDQIRHVVDAKVVSDLSRLDGMADVRVFGGRAQRVEVLLPEELLRSHGLTLSAVNQKIAQGTQPRRFLGQAHDGQRRYFVNLASDYRSLEELRQVIVRDDGLRLGQIGLVLEGTAVGETIARINGREAVSVSLVSDRQANLLELSRATRAAVERLNGMLEADGVELVIERDSAEAIEKNIGDIEALAVLGALLAVGVLWVFLRNLALVAVVAVAVPVSVLIAMNLFYALDLTLNTLSMVGIAVAVGMLLDNSIVVLESIYRQLTRGREVAAAVAAGVRQVWRAVFAATLTTVCVFLPFAFSENFLVGILGRQVGVAIVATLVVSLLVALVLIPVLVHWILRRRSHAGFSFNPVSQRHRPLQVYTLLLKSCMRFPARTVVVAAAALFVSLLVSLAVSVDSGEEVELTSFDLYAMLPGGSTLSVADRLAREMDGRLADVEEVDQRKIDIEAERLHLAFELKEDFYDIDRRNLGMIKRDILERLRSGFPAVGFSWDQPRNASRREGGGGFGSRGFQRLLGIGQASERVVLRGSDLSLMQAIAEDIGFNLGRVPGVRRSDVSVAEGQPEIELLIDRVAGAHFDVPPEAIGVALSDFREQLPSAVRLKRGSQETEVALSTVGHPPRQVDDLRELAVRAKNGGFVPLSQLAGLRYEQGYGRFERINQQKEVSVSYSFEDEVTASADALEVGRSAVDRLVEEIRIPAGMAVEVEHDEAELEEFPFLIGATVVLIFMVLAAVFESLVAPLAMMVTLPLAAVGALWGLTLTGNTLFNANALIGFLILLGVVVNNGIMLIDYARTLQRQGWRLSRALLAAGQVRVRPILITALSTILAMLPLALGDAEYVALIGAPFAIAVIGGLVAGTVFTLVLVPTVYFGLATAVSWLGGLHWRLKTAQVLALAGGAWATAAHVDAWVWQLAFGTALVGLVPGLTWFAQASLRHSRSDLIGTDEPLRIAIRNVVKVYDEPVRFVRQWGRGDRQQGGSGRDRTARLRALTWRLPLLGFHCYFTYFYLHSDVWITISSVAFAGHALGLVWTLLPATGRWPTRLTRFVYHLGYWLLPAAHLAWYRSLWEEPAPVVIVGFVWYLGAAINRGARRLQAGGVIVDSITGRFRRTRRAFYLLVGAIPIVGKRKKPFTALKGVSLEIESGMFGLVGPNGAGKTTLLRIICGILDQSLGKVCINDIDLTQRREELQSLIGYLPQEFGTYESLSARQFLDYQALLKGQWEPGRRREVVDAALGSVHLEGSADDRIGGFSGGMKQRVGIAQTLLHLPRILVVDEPTAGLDPRERIRFRNLLAELARDRVVVFSTHIIEDISSSCNRLAVLSDGEVRFHGNPQEMVELTRGSVWQAEIDDGLFEQIRHSARIVHHMRDGDRIRVRILAGEPPLPGAEAVTPTLEDSYLWLLDQEAG